MVLGALFVIVLMMFGNTAPSTTSVHYLADASWPNCSLQLPTAQVGIVGINGGRPFTTNPCLTKETLNFKTPSVYVNTAYPGKSYGLRFQYSPRFCSSVDDVCLAYNYGYNAGLYDVSHTLSQGIIANWWWLDVETENSWNSNTLFNRAALQGILDAVSGYAGNKRIGFYSSLWQWNLLTGNWRNGYPAWVGTGSKYESVAVKKCATKSFTGGEILLSQFTPDLDQNYICKGSL